jgi:archaellum component FlaF (FlaF/FlaG flagellin family)
MTGRENPVIRRRSRRGSASTLIVLMLVLLVFFGVLSIVTAAADNRLADRRSKLVQAYYAADRTAVEILARLTQTANRAPAATDSMTLKAALEQQLAEFEEVEILSAGSDGRRVDLLLRIWNGGQAIEAGTAFFLPDTPGGNVRLLVTRWTAWQEPFDYENTGGGIWKG